MTSIYHRSTDENPQEERACDVSSFVQDLKGRKAVVIFTQDSCGPCSEYLGALGEIGEQPGVDFAVVDVNSCREVAERFKVEGTPTVLVLHDGAEVLRVPLTGNAIADMRALPDKLPD